MDPSVARLTTPEECEQFIINVRDRHPELAVQATRRAVRLRAARAGARTDAEREALEAVYAYEAVRTQQSGKRFRAQRTWQMIDRHGIVGAVERAVDRPDDAQGYQALVDMNMMDLSFEAVVVRHPSTFSRAAVERSTARLALYETQQAYRKP